MIRNAVFGAVAALAFAAALAPAQAQSLKFDSAVYVTCREAQNMTPESRRSLAMFLANHAARYRGVRIPEGEAGAHLAMLVRGGCTLSPDTHLFAVIDRAIVAEHAKLPKR